MIVSNFKRFSFAAINGGPAGRNALFRKAFSPLTRWLDRQFYYGKSSFENFPPCVIICSPPRSGSTAIYQILSRVLQCGTVTNLHQMMPRHATFLQKFFKSKDSNSPLTKNFYGHTSGFTDVNEGNELVDYWFKTSSINDIRSRFIETVSWLKIDDQSPIIIKNVAIYDRLFLLHQAVPELYFVRLKRNIQQVVESELRAYLELGHLNPVPIEIIESDYKDSISLIIKQISYIERRIDQELSTIPSDMQLNWSYENFFNFPSENVTQLTKKLDIQANWGQCQSKFEVSTRKRVSEKDTQTISSKIIELGETGNYDQ